MADGLSRVACYTIAGVASCLLSSACTTADAAAQRGDARSVFCSNVLTIPGSSLLLGWKLRNTSIVLDQQRICTSEESQAELARCDWEYVIKDEAVLQPENETALRIVSISRSHRTGSGALTTFDVLECRQSELVEVFTTGELLSGGSFQLLSGASFAVTRGHWLQPDAMCCPSHERRTEYQWNGSRHTFLPASTVFFKRDESPDRRTPAEEPGGDDDPRNH